MDETMPAVPEGRMDETMPMMPGSRMDETTPMNPGSQMDEMMPVMPGGQFEEADDQENMIPPLQQGCRNGMGDPMREGCTEQVYPAMPGEQMNQRPAMPGEQVNQRSAAQKEQSNHGAVMPWKSSMENDERMLEEYLMGMPRRI